MTHIDVLGRAGLLVGADPLTPCPRGLAHQHLSTNKGTQS